MTMDEEARLGMPTCWCGSIHPERPDDARETCRVIGHLLVAHLRIPLLVAWMARHLPPPAQPPAWDHCPPAASHTCEWRNRDIQSAAPSEEPVFDGPSFGDYWPADPSECRCPDPLREVSAFCPLHGHSPEAVDSPMWPATPSEDPR